MHFSAKNYMWPETGPGGGLNRRLWKGLEVQNAEGEVKI